MEEKLLAICFAMNSAECTLLGLSCLEWEVASPDSLSKGGFI